MFNDQIKEHEFYSKDFFFSYSSINLLLYHPKLFYNTYVLGQRETKDSPALLEGRLIHLLILEANKFNSKYVVSYDNPPTASIKSIIDKLYYGKLKDNFVTDLSDYRDLILELLREANLYQKLADDKKTSITGDDKRYEKVVNQMGIDYFDHLKSAEGKEVIDKGTYDRCKTGADEILSNEKVRDLLGLNNLNLDRYNEEKLSCDLDDFNFGLKGIIDNFVVNHADKKVIINDVKTTSKSLVEFGDSVNYYNYWLQCVIYKELVLNNSEKYSIGKDYELEFNFIVIDKYNSSYPFKVSADTISKWSKKTKDVIEKVNYHYGNNRFDLPYDLIHENIKL